MKIGLDFDDVIAHLFEQLLEFYNSKKGKNHTLDELIEYDLWVNWNIPKEEAMELINEFHERQEVETTKPIENAIESIFKILHNGDKLWIITARHPRFKHKVEDFIEHHFRGKRIEVITTRDFKPEQHLKKFQICKELDIEIMIEDSGKNALECAKAGIKVILFDNPWNKNFEHENITRVNGWKEAIKILQN